jgi:hypothetical protein
MCDRIPFIKNIIHTTESEVERLSGLFKKCKESSNKGYKCYLISAQINDKKKTLDLLQESLQNHIDLCMIYQQLEMGTN